MSLSVNLTHLLFLLRLFVSNERSSCYCFVPYLYIYIQRITFAFYGFFFSLSGFSVFSEEPSNIRFICFFFFFRGFCLQRKTLAMFYCFLVIFFSLKLFCKNNLSDMGRRTFVKFSALIHHYLKFYKSFFRLVKITSASEISFILLFFLDLSSTHLLKNT